MGGDRHSIIEAGAHMRMAVLTMEEVMRTAGRSELHRSGHLQIESDIRTLEEGCAGLKKLILMAAAALRDGWPEIERNRARIRETSTFFEQYQKFKAVWTGAKNELTYFADWFRKDASQIRMIFDFPDDRKSKEQFALSRHPADKLPESNRLILLLKKYPREIFFK